MPSCLQTRLQMHESGCEEEREPDPSLQAAVSLGSGGGLGVGDSLEMVDTDLVMRTVR